MTNKIYCKNCIGYSKYFENYKLQNLCKLTMKKIDTFLEEEKTWEICKILNKDNDCKLYSERISLTNFIKMIKDKVK
jgi:hypothetical protein